MDGRTLMILLVAAVGVGGRPAVASGQTPTHKHYETPPGEKAEPGKPLAPRLQNLGVHTFKVATANARGQLFINQGRCTRRRSREGSGTTRGAWYRWHSGRTARTGGRCTAWRRH